MESNFIQLLIIFKVYYSYRDICPGGWMVKTNGTLNSHIRIYQWFFCILHTLTHCIYILL